jgi:hypothetical protein
MNHRLGPAPGRLTPLLIFGAATLVDAALALAERIPPQPVDGKIKWVYSYDEGKAAARASGKPLFVVFRCER